MTREGLIEVMARAIWEREGYIDGDFDGDADPFRRLSWDELVAAEGEYNPTVTRAREQATAALAAIEAAGVRLVPDQPTHEMQFAGGTCQGGTEHEGEGEADTIVFPAVIYRAMLAASPYAPAPKDESHE